MRAREMHRARNPLDAPFLLICRALFALGIIAACYGLAINAKQGSYATQQKRTDQLYAGFGAGHPLVQSFQADRAYLNTLVLYASRLIDDPAPATITVRLRHPGADQYLAVQQFYLGRVGEQEMLTFTFPALETSKDSSYELVVETSLPAGSVGVWGSSEDAYAEGTLAGDGKVLPFDLSFFTYYRAPLPGMLDANNLGFFLNMVLMLAFYLAVGFALMLLLDFVEHETLLDALVALVCLSAAFPPVLFALFSFASIKIDATHLAWAFIALFVFSSGAFLYRWKFLGRRLHFPGRGAASHVQDWFVWGLGAILVYALFARAAQVDGLYVPNWIDGLVHQRSLDKLVETGVQSTSQIYHTGFYSHVILASMLTGLSTPEAMLVSGQLFSALGGITFLFLASRFLSSRFALLLSACVYWFLSPFPSYLITWSRYPFLVGLMLLPALMAYSIKILRSASWSWILPWLLIFTGTVLVHYGVIVIYLTFLAAWLSFDGESREQLKQVFKQLGWRLLPILAGLLLPALFFLGPKLMRFFFDPASRQTLVDLSQQAAAQIDTLHILGLSVQNGGIVVWGMAAVGLLAALVYSRKNALLLLVWYGLLGAVTWLQIQAWGIAVSSYADLVISACIPLGVLAGFSVEILFAPTPRLTGFFEKIQVRPAAFAVLSLLVIILAGSYAQLGTVNPISVLFSERDLKAAAWIREETPPAAVILVDSFRWGDTYWPSDGGGWLKALTGRQIVYARSAQDISAIDAWVVSQKAQFVYLGQGLGELSDRHFIDNPVYRVLYQEQGVTILAVNNKP